MSTLYLAGLLVLSLTQGCGTKFSGCGENEPCSAASTAAGGGAAGGSTTSGGASATTSGGSGGTLTATTASATSSSGGSGAGIGGGGGGTGGEAGDGGASVTGGSGGTGGSVVVPCDGACDGATRVCDEATDTCVECLETDDCEEGVCDTAAKECVECLSESDCADPTPQCAPEGNTCVECLGDTHCSEPIASWCDDSTCAPCQTNDHCAHLAGTTVCDAAVGECVECTGTDYASCGVNEDDEPLVCDSLTRTCTDQAEHGGGTCQPCISDAHCPLGQLCVMQMFNDVEVGYFCFWREGETDNGAPETCSSASRPYVEQVPNVTSIDQQVANICGLRTSTCVARNQFSTKDCGTTVPDNGVCGFAPPEDAVCAAFSATEQRCTMTCGTDDDCPVGFPCNTTPLVPYCEL